MAERAKPDSMLVLGKHLTDARRGVAGQGALAALDALGEREPALAGYIGEGLASLVGKLALAGAPSDLVRGVHSEALSITLGAVEAQRAATSELWEGTTFGTLLETFGKPPAPPKRPRRRKGQDGARP
ncbi:MAG: hypothetical protein K2W96_21380 [Gemmataceae bacterium]|nr:hypothetical protein [Gemmataceae bacterium]